MIIWIGGFWLYMVWIWIGDVCVCNKRCLLFFFLLKKNVLCILWVGWFLGKFNVVKFSLFVLMFGFFVIEKFMFVKMVVNLFMIWLIGWIFLLLVVDGCNGKVILIVLLVSWVLRVSFVSVCFWVVMVLVIFVLRLFSVGFIICCFLGVILLRVFICLEMLFFLLSVVICIFFRVFLLLVLFMVVRRLDLRVLRLDMCV